MKRYILTAFAAFSAFATLSAQNLSPKVEVTNDYLTDFSDLQKYSVGMTVPDSLLKFNLAFDYSVFDNPYKGSYEFSPYSIRLTPDKSQYDGGKFYMRLGAGYQIRPEFKLFWTPVTTEKCRFSIFQDLGGFYGKYYAGNTGFDIREKLGLAGQVNLKGSDFNYSVAYDGMAVSRPTETAPSLYHTGKVGISFRTSLPQDKRFYYELNLDYLFGLDSYCTNVMENALHLYGTVAPVSVKRFRLMIDYDADGQMYANSWSGYGYNARITPRACFKFGVLNISGGAKVGVYYLDKLNTKIYPDVRLSVDALPNYLRIYAGYRGDVDTYDYNRLKVENRHMIYNLALFGNVIGYSQTDMDAFAGFAGNITNHFQYDLSGGYVKIADRPMMSVSGYYFAKSFNYWHADAKLAWRSEHVDVDFTGRFNKTDISDDEIYNLPLLKGEMGVKYNWNRRLYVGLDCEASTEREAKNSVPAYVDLGADLEWKFACGISVWLRAGNLLNMRIERIPGYAEQGPSYLGGIGLNF